MKKIIKKILKEDQRERYLNKIINFMKNDYPLFHNLKDYGFYDQLTIDELNYVLSGIFGMTVNLGMEEYHPEYIVYNNNGKEIYFEDLDGGNWTKSEYDKNGNLTYTEHSDGEWYKREYDENGNIIYYGSYDGDWEKKEYDNNGNVIYYENFTGYWIKKEYNENGDLIYYEDSDGYIEDRR
jgi:hypothetical protein